MRIDHGYLQRAVQRRDDIASRQGVVRPGAIQRSQATKLPGPVSQKPNAWRDSPGWFAVSQFAGTLGLSERAELTRQLEGLESALEIVADSRTPAEATAIASEMVGAVSRVAEELRGSPRRLAAVCATAQTLTRLVDAEIASAPDANTCRQLATALTRLASELSGRSGGNSAFATFPVWISLVAACGQVAPACGPLVDFLAKTGPKAELPTAWLSSRTNELEQSLAARRADLAGALADVTQAVRAEVEAELAAARQAVGVPTDASRQPLQAALVNVLEKSLEGPASLYAAAVELDSAVRALVDPAEAHLAAIARMVELTGTTQLGQRVLTHVKEHLEAWLVEGPPAVGLEAPGADAGTVARALVTHSAESPAIAEELMPSLAQLEAHSPEVALRVALAAVRAARETPAALVPTFEVLTERALAAAGDLSNSEAFSIAPRFARVYVALEPVQLSEESRRELSLALAPTFEKVPNKKATDELAASVLAFSQLVPGLDAGPLFYSPDRPSVRTLLDPQMRYRHADPFQLFLFPLVQNIPGHFRADPEKVRVAIELATLLGNIDGNPNPLFGRVLGDWINAQQRPADQGIAMGKNSLEGLPLELVSTAQVHLSADQQTWLSTTIVDAGWRDTVRNLRDFTFACVHVGRLDLFDALSDPNVTVKTRNAVASQVGRAFRDGRLHEIDVNGYIQALQEGRNPAAEADAVKAAAALQGLNVPAAERMPASEGDYDPAADLPLVAQQLAGMKPVIDNARMAGLMDVLPAGASLAAPWEAVISDVQQGTWPQVKYSNDVGVRMLSKLSDEQKALWRQESVTRPGDDAAVEPVAAEPEKALPLLRGLALAMPQQLKLDAGLCTDLGLTWDAASRDRLTAERDQMLETLRAMPKDAPERRAMGDRMSRAQRSLQLLDLKVAFDTAVAHPKPAQGLLEARASLAAAQKLFRQLHLDGAAETAESALELTRSIKRVTREGKYAADEDRFAALLGSHKSGCVNAINGGRRWGMVGAVSDANIRMIRTMDGENQKVRAFLKFFHADLPGYSGPVLWVDPPIADGGGNAADTELLWEHAARKAFAMNVPLTTGANYQIPPSVSAKLNAPLTRVAVSYIIDIGNTGLMHSDSMWGGFGSLVANVQGEATEFQHTIQASVMMPPGLAKGDV